MIRKQEQRSWIKIEVARCHSTQECFQGLLEACCDAAFPYRTVTRWEGREGVQDNLRTGQPHMENNTVQLIASLLHADRQWIAYDLAADVRVYHKTVLHILHDILGYRKFSSR